MQQQWRDLQDADIRRRQTAQQGQNQLALDPGFARFDDL
jgi:hypothetical protein